MEPRNKRRFRWGGFLALLFLLLAAGALIFLLSGPQFEVGPYRARVTSSPTTLFEKAQGKVRLWMLAHNLVPAGSVLVEGKFLTLKNADEVGLLALPLDATALETDEVKAWIVERAWSDEMFRRLLKRPGNRIESTPRVMTRSYQAGSVFMGGSAAIHGTNLTDYGLQVAALPVIRGENIGLTLDALSSELVMIEPPPSADPAAPAAMLRTNIAFSARLLLPPDKVLFVLDKRQGTETATHVFMVSARVRPGH